MNQKNWNRLDKLCRSCHGNKKGGFNFFGIPFIKLHSLIKASPRNVSDKLLTEERKKERKKEEE
jgi:hypothetical protein